MNAILDFFKKLFGIDSPPTPVMTDPCSAPACVDAKSKLKAARDGFNRICDGLRMLNAITKILQQILSAPIWILVALAVIAIIVGGWIAIVLFALIAVYALAWFLLPIVGLMAGSLAATLDKRKTDFTNALPDVVAQCPEACRGDLSPPLCLLE